MWKFHNCYLYLCITQILRGIDFEDSRCAKSAIATRLKALDFDIYDFLLFLKVDIYQINKIRSPYLEW